MQSYTGILILRENKFMKYKTKIDEDKINMYADRSCKECYGRGIQTYDNGKGTYKYHQHCSCVIKMMKKIKNRTKS